VTMISHTQKAGNVSVPSKTTVNVYDPPCTSGDLNDVPDARRGQGYIGYIILVTIERRLDAKQVFLYIDYAGTQTMLAHRSCRQTDHTCTQNMLAHRSCLHTDHACTQIMLAPRSFLHPDHACTQNKLAHRACWHTGTQNRFAM
jgi:ribosomal protein L32